MRDRTKMYLHLFITLFIMLFIFRRSALPADLSTLESSRLSAFIAGLLSMDYDLAEVLVRKTAHFTEYAVLGASLSVNVRDFLRWKGIRAVSAAAAFAVPWLIGTLYAVSDEIHQHFVPGRSCELRDMVIDACGVAVGTLAVMALSRKAGQGAGPCPSREEVNK